METAAPEARGLQQLEEALLYQAELMDLHASLTDPPEGVVIEARMDRGHGPVATLIVKQGTLKASGMYYGLQILRLQAQQYHLQFSDALPMLNRTGHY